MSQIIRRVYTFNTLIGAASTHANQAMIENEFDNSLSAILLCALSIEAHLNHVGARLFPIWSDHLEKKLTPKGKLALITQEIKQDIDFSRQPFQLFNSIFEFRNQLAHGKTEDCDYSKPKSWLILEDKKWPATKWEVYCTSENATKLVRTTKEIIDHIDNVSGLERTPSFLLSEHIDAIT